MLQELAHRKNKSQIVDTQTRLLTYLAANWHLLNSDQSNQTDDQKFWDSFALACQSEQTKQYTEKNRKVALIKESMMKALNFELDRVQLFLLSDSKTIVEPLMRQKRESYEKNESCSLSRYLKTLALPEVKAN